MSSAYNRIDTLSSSSNGTPQFRLRIAWIKSFTNALNKRGDKTQPCFKPA